MIKFFRHIRKSLLSDGKFSKYLLYAIGEIILVVIGILIALQINNANQERKNRQKEAIILGQIHQEFKSNKVQLDSIKLNNENVIAGCDAIIRMLPFQREKSTVDSLMKYMAQVTKVKTFNPSNGSVDALINSSSFEVIQNDSLRILLVSWKDRCKDYSEEEQYARDFQIWEFQPYQRKNFNFFAGPSPENLDQMVKPEFMNFFLEKRSTIIEVQNAIRDEGIEHYINEIIRLTKDYD